jgi:hypothetical protein
LATVPVYPLVTIAEPSGRHQGGGSSDREGDEKILEAMASL